MTTIRECTVCEPYVARCAHFDGEIVFMGDLTLLQSRHPQRGHRFIVSRTRGFDRRCLCGCDDLGWSGPVLILTNDHDEALRAFHDSAT